MGWLTMTMTIITFDVSIHDVVLAVGGQKNILEFGEEPYKVLVRTIVTKLSCIFSKFAIIKVQSAPLCVVLSLLLCR